MLQFNLLIGFVDGYHKIIEEPFPSYQRGYIWGGIINEQNSDGNIDAIALMTLTDLQRHFADNGIS